MRSKQTCGVEEGWMVTGACGVEEGGVVTGAAGNCWRQTTTKRVVKAVI